MPEHGFLLALFAGVNLAPPRGYPWSQRKPCHDPRGFVLDLTEPGFEMESMIPRIEQIGGAPSRGILHPTWVAARKSSGREKRVMDARRAWRPVFIDSCCSLAGSAYSIYCF